MTDIEQAMVLMRDLWTLLAKADEMLAEAMRLLESAADQQRGMALPPTRLSGLVVDGNTASR